MPRKVNRREFVVTSAGAGLAAAARAHHAYTLTGAICTAVAALIPNTIVADVAGLPTKQSGFSKDVRPRCGSEIERRNGE